MFTFPVGLLEKDTPSATDPFYNNVSLLLLANDVNNSTTFIDSGPANRNVTTFLGNPVITTAESKFGGSSLTGGIIQTPYNSAFDFGTGDFTIEFWFRYIGSLPFEVRFTYANGNTPYFSFGSFGDSIALLLEGVSWETSINWTRPLPNTWTHIAGSRQSGTVRFFNNGNLLGSYSSSRNWTMNNNPFVVSANITTAGGTTFIDDFRITKGVARYTAAFTPPTSQLPTM